MENFEDFENKSYRPTKELKYSLSDHLNFAFKNVCTFLQIFLVAFYEIFKSLLLTRQPKDISGQLALVTGLCLSNS